MINWLERNTKFSWTITFLLAITIFYVSTLTGGKIGGKGSTINATAYHILIFFLFSLFLFISLIKGKYKELISLGIILSFAYALTDELHQYFVPGRSSSFSDVGLDFIGVIFASIIYFISLEYRNAGARNRTLAGTKPLPPQGSPFDRSGTPA